MLYLGLTFFLFFLRYAVVGRGSSPGRFIYYPVLLGLFVFSAFRYNVGCDWSGYYYQFVRATDFDWSTLVSNREPIWWAILAWINKTGLPYPVANIVSSALFFIGVHVLARRQPDPLGFLVLLLPILIINMPMSGIRQGAAIGLMCIAYTSFIDRRPLRFVFWVGLAAGFHASALVFILLLPLTMGRYTLSRLILAGILAIPGAVFLATSESGEVAITRYVNTGVDAIGAAFRVGILSLSGLYFLLFLRRKWRGAWPRDHSLASIGAILMVMAILLLPISSVIGDRLAYYLIPIQAMIFARIPFLPIPINAPVFAVLPYFALLLVFGIWSQLSWHFGQCYVPYQTWIFGFPGGDPVGFL